MKISEMFQMLSAKRSEEEGSLVFWKASAETLQANYDFERKKKIQLEMDAIVKQRNHERMPPLLRILYDNCSRNMDRTSTRGYRYEELTKMFAVTSFATSI